MTPRSTVLTLRQSNHKEWPYDYRNASPAARQSYKQGYARHVRRHADDFIVTGWYIEDNTGPETTWAWTNDDPTQVTSVTFETLPNRGLSLADDGTDRDHLIARRRLDSYWRHVEVLTAVEKTGTYTALPCRPSIRCRCCWRAD